MILLIILLVITIICHAQFFKEIENYIEDCIEK